MMKLGYRSGKLGKELTTFLEFMTAPASKILDKWFESDILKATLATDAIIGAKVFSTELWCVYEISLDADLFMAMLQVSPSTPGSAYILFHHVMGEVNGIKGMWGHVKGGMGGVSQALEKSATEAGVEIFTNAPVKSIDVHDGKVQGVSLVSGEVIESDFVLSNASPLVTMLDLLDEKVLPERVVTHFKKNWNCESASTKVCVYLVVLVAGRKSITLFTLWLCFRSTSRWTVCRTSCASRILAMETPPCVTIEAPPILKTRWNRCERVHLIKRYLDALPLTNENLFRTD